jgi:hypothetical protein
MFTTPTSYRLGDALVCATLHLLVKLVGNASSLGVLDLAVYNTYELPSCGALVCATLLLLEKPVGNANYPSITPTSPTSRTLEAQLNQKCGCLNVVALLKIWPRLLNDILMM